MVEKTCCGFLEASYCSKEVGNIKLFTNFLSGLVDLSHSGPACRGQAKGVEPIINGIAQIIKNSKIFFLDFSTSLIKGKSCLGSIKFIAVLVKRGKEKSHDNPEQSKKSTHIREHFIDFVHTSINSEFFSRLKNFQVNVSA